jgi:hypothetical protein
MAEKEKDTTAKRILDTVVISSLTSLIASIVGGVAFYVYSQAQTATYDIRDIKIQLETIQKDIEKTNETIIGEIAPLKAEHDIADRRFEEIDKYIKSQSVEFLLPENPTYDDIKKEEDDLKNQFNTTQQQSPLR